MSGAAAIGCAALALLVWVVAVVGWAITHDRFMDGGEE
jgi:hypothetical protein